MNEPLLIPQHAQSLHVNISKILTAWGNAFHQFASTLKGIVRNVAHAIEQVKRRKRSVRRTYAEAILKEKPVAYYRLGETFDNIIEEQE